MGRVIAIVIDHTVYEYDEDGWLAIWSGEAPAPENVLRYVIKDHLARYLQARDETLYCMDLHDIAIERIEELETEVAQLRKQQTLGWESKPAKAKRKVKAQA